MPEQAGAQPPEASAEPSPVAHAEAPSIAPDHETPPKPDAPKPDAPKAEASKADVSKPRAAAEPEPKAGKLIVMASSERAWDREHLDARPDATQDARSTRRLSAMAAVVALAAIVGAISGALATAGVMHFAANEAPAAADDTALEASVARIDADIVALKANLEHTAKAGVGQFNKTSDRLDKLEKAQAEPMVRIAKLSEAVDKLRAAPPAVTAQAAAPKETTGSIAPAQTAAAAPAQAAAPAAATPPKTEIGRLPTVEGWRLRDVAHGGALIESRRGLYEVYAGDPVPGLGRIDAIRRQDGRWVVVTSKGLIVAR